MIVVSDTSAVTALLQVGEEGLLKQLYREVLIPEAVEKELLDAVEAVAFRKAGEF
jgi:predicted nucleic acid-binding protein